MTSGRAEAAAGLGLLAGTFILLAVAAAADPPEGSPMPDGSGVEIDGYGWRYMAMLAAVTLLMAVLVRGVAGGGRPAPAQSAGRPFTVIMPVRGTPREMAFIPKSVPAAMALGPRELLLALDADAPPWVAEACEAAAAGGPVPCRIIRVERDPGWNFHLAKVTYEASKACATDVALWALCDAVILPGAKAGLAEVGPRVPAVSVAMRRGGSRMAAWQNLIIRLSLRLKGPGFTGLYWVHVQTWLALCDRGRLAALHNGIDTFFKAAVDESPGRSVLCLSRIGGRMLDLNQRDYPINQFAMGLWAAANPATADAFWLWLGNLAFFRAWSVRGWRYGLRHRDGPHMAAARGTTLQAYLLHKPHTLVGIRDFGIGDRIGFGQKVVVK